MLSRILNKLGTPGFAILVVALVVALTAGAFAAGGALTTKEKKEVTAIAKRFAGEPGASGTQGSPGAPGANGTNGGAGKSVVVTGEAAGANCKSGGVKVEVEGNAASRKFVCNGLAGFTETLPSGETETGAWSYGLTPSTVAVATSSISFDIPLAEGTLPEFHYVKTAGEDEAECPGNAAEPAAAEGNFCVYQGPLTENPGTLQQSLTALTYNRSGVTLVFNTPQIEGSSPAEFKASLIAGGWAVTPN